MSTIHITRKHDLDAGVVRDAAQRLADKLANEYKASYSWDGDSVKFSYTGLDGVSNVFAAGRYNDIIDVSGNRPLLRAREVRLDTRDLGGGTHFPI